MRILVIGAAGFIGANFVQFCVAQGHEVIGLCRSGHIPGFTGKCVKWNLQESLPLHELHDISCAIHLAHDFNGKAGAQLTKNQTLEYAVQLRQIGIPHQIFFSSYSAGEHAVSLYGKTKLEIEKKFEVHSDIVIVRPGLVMGQGGIYGRIQHWAKRLLLIPLPDGGHGQVPVISIERLCIETLKLVEEQGISGPQVNLFEHKLRSLRELVLDAAAEAGRKPWILPLPATLVVFALKVAEGCRIPLPVNADNLIGFLQNQNALHASSLKDNK